MPRPAYQRQKRKEVRKMRTEFSVPPTHQMELISRLAFGHGAPEEKRAYLLQNLPESVQYVRKLGAMLNLPKAKIDKKYVEFLLEKGFIKGQILDLMATGVATHHATNLGSRITGKLSALAKTYLKRRDIPFDKDAFLLAERKLYGSLPLNALAKPENTPRFLALFEKEFFAQRNRVKRVHQETNTLMNLAVKSVFPEKMLTRNQFRSVRRWFSQNMDRVVSQPLFEFISGHGKDLTVEMLNQKRDELFNNLFEAARKQFKDYYQAPQRAVSSSRPVRASGVSQERKLGSREERIANYLGKEKSVEAAHPKKQPEPEAPKKFDPVRDALTRLSILPGAGTAIQRFWETGSLLPSQVDLFSKRPKSTVVFMKAVNSGFVEQFGESEIKNLAKMALRLNGLGVKEGHLRGSVGSARSAEMLQFLLKKEIVALHGHDKVVYAK